LNIAPVGIVFAMTSRAWHVTKDTKEKVVAEIVMVGAVKHCGLFVCPTDKCFATKPDGVILDGIKDNKKATFCIVKPKPGNYLKALAHADLICSGFDIAVLVAGCELLEF
jgi:hypothetical protein